MPDRSGTIKDIRLVTVLMVTALFVSVAFLDMSSDAGGATSSPTGDPEAWMAALVLAQVLMVWIFRIPENSGNMDDLSRVSLLVGPPVLWAATVGTTLLGTLLSLVNNVVWQLYLVPAAGSVALAGAIVVWCTRVTRDLRFP